MHVMGTLLLFQDAEKWLSALQKQMRDQSQTLLPIDEVQERLREAVHAHFYTLANLFKEVDYADIGVISKEDFRDVIYKNVMRFTDEQVCVTYSDRHFIYCKYITNIYRLFFGWKVYFFKE